MPKIIIKNSAGEMIKEFDQDINKTLITQMNNAGAEVMSACHHGLCGACMYTVESGGEGIIKNFKGEPGFPLGDNEVMTCIAGIGSETTGDIILKENS